MDREAVNDTIISAVNGAVDHPENEEGETAENIEGIDAACRGEKKDGCVENDGKLKKGS